MQECSDSIWSIVNPSHWISYRDIVSGKNMFYKSIFWRDHVRKVIFPVLVDLELMRGKKFKDTNLVTLRQTAGVKFEVNSLWRGKSTWVIMDGLSHLGFWLTSHAWDKDKNKEEDNSLNYLIFALFNTSNKLSIIVYGKTTCATFLFIFFFLIYTKLFNFANHFV